MPPFRCCGGCWMDFGGRQTVFILLAFSKIIHRSRLVKHFIDRLPSSSLWDLRHSRLPDRFGELPVILPMHNNGHDPTKKAAPTNTAEAA